MHEPLDKPFPASSHVDRLGFGGSNLLGNKTPEEGIALLETAFEHGIRHFDTAPMYGYGDAEVLLGRFAQGKRDRLTIATKFGLQPIKGLAQGKAVKLLRRVMQFSPAIRKLVRRNAGSAIRTGQFDVPSAAASLEDSLRKLQTDCIDIFLLHECELSNCTDELLRFLEDARSAGKIKTFGIGTSFDQVEAIVIHKPEFCPVVQFKSNIVSQNIHLLRGKKNASEYPSNFITHGSFEPVKEILRRAKVDLAWTARWSKEIQADIADADVVVGLTLQQALHANEGGKILFQSSSLSRVAKNIHLAEIPKFCGEQLRAFERLGADLLPLHAD